MFILRQTAENGAEVNTSLGKEYTFVNPNNKDFKAIIDANELRGDITGLVFDDDRNIHPIYANNGRAYIVMDSGKTFFRFKEFIEPK